MSLILDDDQYAASSWSDAVLAAVLLAIDPSGLGGVVIRARAAPVRDEWLKILRQFLPAAMPFRRIAIGISDHRLLGGLDLAATLQTGRSVVARGILAQANEGLVVLAMAERLQPDAVARLTQVLDRGEVLLERDGIGERHVTKFGIVALDEGADEDEQISEALADRMALRVDFTDLTHRDMEECYWSNEDVLAARAELSKVKADFETIEALCEVAAALGIASVRAPFLALRVACAAAALDGRIALSQADVVLAGRLVLAPRATILPQSDDAPQPQPNEPPRDDTSNDNTSNDEAQQPPNQQKLDEGEDDTSQSSETLEDIVLEAAKAAIPAGLLAKLRIKDSRAARTRSAGKVGVLKNAGARGRPVGVLRGIPRPGMRLNVLATLRAAAPWQRLRRTAAPTAAPNTIRVLVDDFHVTRIKQRSATVTIFAVDASGSSALNRLNEAKGAVELLLADCYIRRDQVAVIVFRGKSSALILPPTRSLVRAKRALASMAGGGGTPLASGIDSATLLAIDLRRRGLTPVIVLMTDGAANVDRTGAGGRAAAAKDAIGAAQSLKSAGLSCVLIDTAPRPQAFACEIAREMAGLYVALPHANAQNLTQAVRVAATL